MKKLREICGSNILLDTNILVHYASQGFEERSSRILRVLGENKNLLTISEITGFELLNSDPKDNRRKKYLTFINGVPNHPVNREILKKAAILSNECKRLTNSPNRVFPLPDLIIGGTIMNYAEGTLHLLTTDRHDFFEPLWELIAYEQVLKEDKNCIDADIYLLKLNREVLLPE